METESEASILAFGLPSSVGHLARRAIAGDLPMAKRLTTTRRRQRKAQPKAAVAAPAEDVAQEDARGALPGNVAQPQTTSTSALQVQLNSEASATKTTDAAQEVTREWNCTRCVIPNAASQAICTNCKLAFKQVGILPTSARSKRKRSHPSYFEGTRSLSMSSLSKRPTHESKHDDMLLPSPDHASNILDDHCGTSPGPTTGTSGVKDCGQKSASFTYMADDFDATDGDSDGGDVHIGLFGST